MIQERSGLWHVVVLADNYHSQGPAAVAIGAPPTPTVTPPGKDAALAAMGATCERAP